MHSNLDDVAELADKIYEVAPAQPQIASTSTNNNNNIQIDEMVKHVENLITSRIEHEVSRQIAQISSANGARGRSPFRHRQNGGRNRMRSGICWYHERFGDKAQKCTTPCAFTSLNKVDSQ